MTTDEEIITEREAEEGIRPKREKRGIFRIMTVWSFVFFMIALIAVGVHVALYLSPSFADAFNGTVSAGFRLVLAKITSIYPASLAELVILAAPIILFLVLRGIWRYMGRAKHGFIRSLCAILSVAALMYSLFVFDFAAGYRTTRLPERMGLTVEKTDAETLYSVTETVIERLNAEVPEVGFCSDGSSVMPYSHEELVSKITEAYDKVCAEYPFIKNFKAPVKRLVVSPVMTYTHISGVFSFYTGEANLNTNYPDFVNVFSTAHEMAHQRGIAREDEANFVAYLVLIRSDDHYLRYCGYLSMYEYLADPLWGASKDLYGEAASSLDNAARLELKAYSAFFAKYKNSSASKVAEKINDGYLVIQGTEGVKSYGLVADLAIAYHLAGN
ncbi:MAG: DUF3810 domain-containing protein [Clostridia bacterium]|nr:DUF3810 domain-containing protein [Clostridia bacterium]